jgi:3-oxoacyl-[acyl-carrier protein] reductase
VRAGSVALVTGAAGGIGQATVLKLAHALSGDGAERGSQGAATPPEPHQPGASDWQQHPRESPQRGVQGGAAPPGRRRRDKPAIVLAYHTRHPDETAAKVRELGVVEVLCVQADMRDDTQIRAMFRQVEERFGPELDLLVNNAAITHWVPVTDLDGLTDEMWRDVLDVDLIGPFRCVRAAAPLLKAAHGSVINVASISGVLAAQTTSSLAYGAAKAALMYLTRGLAVALAPEVRVNAVAPAFTDTAWMQSHYGDAYANSVQRAAQTIPLGRVASPEDVADAIVSLALGSRFVTGQTLLVDGGLSLS